MSSLDELESVEATVNYLADPESSDPSRELEYYITDVARTNMLTEPHRVRIRNVRRLADALDLDREGFRLVPHHSAIADFRDDAEVAAQLPSELSALIRDLTGAAAALPMGWQLRFAETSDESEGRFNAHPARFAHGDFTDESLYRPFEIWPGLKRDDYSRFAIYNVWRVITPPPQDVPLAICDYQSLAPRDRVDATAVLDAPGQAPFRSVTSVYRSNPAHRWCYFKDMTSDEVLVFKTADSDKSRAHHVPHTAFSDPTCPAGAPPRGSLEARVLTVFN